MEVEAIPSVEDMTAWMRLPFDVLKRAEELAAPAWDVRQALRGVYTSVPIGVYLKEVHAGVYVSAVCDEAGEASPQDVSLVKAAVERACPSAVGVGEIPMLGAEPAIATGYVKVAYSPFLRTAGQYLNFFPGKYPGGIPNSPGPVQSMLTSGLVGAGLGYGAGWAAEQLLPDKWKRGRLRKTLAAAGGLAGAVPGGLWAASNVQQGKPLNDASLLAGPPPETYKAACDALAKLQLGTRWREATTAYAEKLAADDAAMLKEAFGDTFNGDFGTSPLAVNVDTLGRTLWETGASPQTAGMTMGALAAAQQMPGGEEPGFVTPQQMANLAVHMGAGYLSGAIVGKTLGLLTGMPESAQDTLKQTGLYLGIVKSVIPRLFGQ